MGWSDRQEVDIRGGLAAIDVTQLPDEAIARIRAGEHPLAVLASLAKTAGQGGANPSSVAG